jgi:hypothetical protein
MGKPTQWYSRTGCYSGREQRQIRRRRPCFHDEASLQPARALSAVLALSRKLRLEGTGLSDRTVFIAREKSQHFFGVAETLKIPEKGIQDQLRAGKDVVSLVYLELAAPAGAAFFCLCLSFRHQLTQQNSGNYPGVRSA